MDTRELPCYVSVKKWGFHGGPTYIVSTFLQPRACRRLACWMRTSDTSYLLASLCENLRTFFHCVRVSRPRFFYEVLSPPLKRASQYSTVLMECPALDDLLLVLRTLAIALVLDAIHRRRPLEVALVELTSWLKLRNAVIKIYISQSWKLETMQLVDRDYQSRIESFGTFTKSAKDCRTNPILCIAVLCPLSSP